MATAKFDLQQLSDRAAIGDVIVRYATAYDMHDDELLASCFTDDARAEYSGGLKIEGGGVEIARFLRNLANSSTRPGPMARHFITNVVIELDGDTAAVKSYAVAYRPGQERTEPVNIRSIRYRDRFVREADGEWRIVERIHIADWQANAQGLPIAPVGGNGAKDQR